MSSYNPLLDNEYDSEAAWGSKGRRLEPSYEFAEKSIRQGFIRKVFGLLSIQLAITVGVSVAFMFSDPVRSFTSSNPWMLWTAVACSFILVLTLSFWEGGRRKHPYNLIMLFAFTACESVLVGAVSAVYNTNVVLLAAGITACTVVSLTAFAMQTKYDLTASSGVLLTLLFSLLFASILQAFIHVPWLQLGISIGGALLFSAYLVFDIQLLMGGGAMSISPDEYVFAALALYLDIINLFFYILQLVNEMTRNR